MFFSIAADWIRPTCPKFLTVAGGLPQAAQIKSLYHLNQGRITHPGHIDLSSHNFHTSLQSVLSDLSDSSKWKVYFCRFANKQKNWANWSFLLFSFFEIQSPKVRTPNVNILHVYQMFVGKCASAAARSGPGTHSSGRLSSQGVIPAKSGPLESWVCGSSLISFRTVSSKLSKDLAQQPSNIFMI